MSRPAVIGVTGGIGAGKSAAVDAFARRGAAVFSADAVVHDLYGSDDVRDAVVDRWGDAVLAPDGSVDREAIAGIVFADPVELAWLEGLLHPLVAREWLRFIEAQRALPEPPDVVVAEVPLLFEAGLEDRYDHVVLVTAPLDVRLRRAGERATGSSHPQRRSARQMSDADKRERADVVIENTGSLADLDEQVARVIEQLTGARS